MPYQKDSILQKGLNRSAVCQKSCYIQEATFYWKSKKIGVEEHCLKTVLFPDDPVIINNEERDAVYIFRKLKEEYESCGLTINTAKARHTQDEDSNLHLYKIKGCNESIYLGSIISTNMENWKQ